MSAPLSISPYNSRFDIISDNAYINQFEYINMVYHKFYGGSALQSQELNELQEQCQNQLTQYSNLIENWGFGLNENYQMFPYI